MKRRRGVTVFSALALAFLILAAAAFAVVMLVLAPMFEKEAAEAKVIGEAFDLVARNKDILAAFTTIDQNNITPNAVVFGSVGLFAVLTIIWLIIDLRRGRKICFFFIIVFLLSTYVEMVYYFALTPSLQEFVKAYAEQYPVVLVPVGCALLAALASLFSVVLFIVDMATGGVERPATPTFIKEPTEEIEEGVFEEVKDENEVEEAPKQEETPAPAPVVAEEASEPVEEEKVEEEEAPAPAKKAPTKKPAKKAEPKKEEKKPAPKKAEPKKEEKKPAPAKKAPAKKAEPKKEEKKPEPKKEDENRKTQTILLTNEEGNTYAKAFHVSRRPELNKWQVKATGSDKALKLFNTQKEAIEYANTLAKNQNVSVRVHSKEGKIRKHNG